MKLEYVVSVDKNNCSINDILKNEFNISNRLLSFLIRNNLVFCNGRVCDTRNLVSLGDVISVSMDYIEDNSNIVPAQMDLDIIYEDEWLLVLNKPAGMAVHPSCLHYLDSLCNGVCYYFNEIGLKKKIRVVNRLDFYTSGIVVFAKCSYIHEALSMQMSAGNFSKYYFALVHGKLSDNEGVIDLPIARKSGSIIERCVDFENGKKSVTEYWVCKFYEDTNCSLVKCHLVTGRTHQIRVHFASIGHPLVGDSLYGDSCLDDGQKLHCYCLDFIHPVTHENMHFEQRDFSFDL